MDEHTRQTLSKLLSLMLRHKPEMFGLRLDPQGFASLTDVVAAARQKLPDVTEDQVRDIVEDAEKKRFEITGDRIRARYGHSFPIDLGLAPIDPPEFLYYATTPTQAPHITADGLRPLDRQYVHLSLTPDIAAEVAKNRTETPVVFRVLARKAAAAGVQFFDRTPVILTTLVPPEFLEVVEASKQAVNAFYGRRRRLKTPRPKLS
ncbi:MAG: RNA 2'-phosphotransferase [Candidatus Latescibacteria bacterium]|nr:RNA 2'-phosphotransferase [Candidatus Latescibacterota bacterium]